MGWINPSPPEFDVELYRTLPHNQRVKVLVQDWGVNGFGTPYAVFFLYLFKIAAYAYLGLLFVSMTPGLGTVGNLNDWWYQPIVFEKLIAWTILWEIIGLGSSSGPLAFRFLPPIGNVLYWVRPGTVRLPPFPKQVPLTAGHRRQPIDVLLYLGMIASTLLILTADPTSQGLVPRGLVIPYFACLAVMGLRDKIVFLCSRVEVYTAMLVIFMLPADNLIFALKLAMCVMWWGVASSKINHHFPFVVSVMISNTPWQRSKRVKKLMWRDYPGDMRPSRLCGIVAHSGTVVEFLIPLLMLIARGGVFTIVVVTIMVIFHIHITSTFPLAVPLEWNVFFIFSTLFLFGHYAHVGASTLTDPAPIALVLLVLVAMVVVGSLWPGKMSFLTSMKWYAGNWATTMWLFRRDGSEERVDEQFVKSSPLVVTQLAKLYGRDAAEIMVDKGVAFRAMHTHGRALHGLIPHAVDDVEQYKVREGEFMCGALVGWNFGEGHFHDERLLAAVQDQCHFEPGQLRIITMESQPWHQAFQHYRIFDAATGLMEEGDVAVAEMTARQPWVGEGDDIEIPTLRTERFAPLGPRRSPVLPASGTPSAPSEGQPV